ncbi:MAG: release factor glutamine methyltransferase [Kangiellaceae bacterium]|jgi:release factor glutamine methyltransferase
MASLINVAINAAASIQVILADAAKQISAQAELTFSHPALESRFLLQFVVDKNHAWLIAHADECLSAEQFMRFYKLLNERLTGKPIAFILGTQDFWSLSLKVADCTLIPRQDTELLVEIALSLSLKDSANVLDLGTGTGAIALALAKENPNWSVTGLDRVQGAVELATENAVLNHLKVNFLQSDWFSQLSTTHLSSYDLIVTNPPYVEADSDYLTQGDLRFEPLCALVAADDGLADIRTIIEQSTQYLRINGYLLIEHGHTQSEAVQALLCAVGFSQVKSFEDYNKIPRVTLACWS